MIHHLAHSLSGDKLCVKIYFQSPVVSVLVVPLITVVILSHIICIVRSVTVSQVSLGCRALQSHPCSPSAHRLLSLHICPLPPSLPPAGECWSQVSLCKSCRQFVSRARTETISGREVRLRLVTSVLSRGDVNNPTPHFSLRQVLSDNKTCSRARESSRERGSQSRPPPTVCWSSLS